MLSKCTVNQNIITRKNERIAKLQKKGFRKITNNIFMKKNKVIVLKTMVSTTNGHEIDSLSIKESTYNIIKDKNITVEVFKRNCFRSSQFEIVKINVDILSPTYTYRNKKYNVMRYKIISFDSINIFFNYVNNLDFTKLELVS